MHNMLSKNGSKNRSAQEQQLLRQYSALKMIEIKPKDHYLHSIGGFIPYYAYKKILLRNLGIKSKMAIPKPFL